MTKPARLTRAALQRWLDAQPPLGRVNPDDACRCILAQHCGKDMYNFISFYDGEWVPEWAVRFQKLAMRARRKGTISWRTAARLLREMGR